MGKVPTVLIDRGDLASELGIFEVAHAVTEMTNSAHQRNTAVLVATQFLSSMTNTPTPLISELFDLHAALAMGVDGIQFSDETAVGLYPAKCLSVLLELRKRMPQTP